SAPNVSGSGSPRRDVYHCEAAGVAAHDDAEERAVIRDFGDGAAASGEDELVRARRTALGVLGREVVGARVDGVASDAPGAESRTPVPGVEDVRDATSHVDDCEDPCHAPRGNVGGGEHELVALGSEQWREAHLVDRDL